MTDLEVLNLAHSTKSILLTEDSDFGEWVFVHKAETSGIIFLRYRPEEIKRIGNTLRQVLHEKQDSLYKKYVVLTPDKIRIRTLKIHFVSDDIFNQVIFPLRLCGDFFFNLSRTLIFHLVTQ